MSIQPEMESAIDEVTNEAIVKESKEEIALLNLDDVNQPEIIKKKIHLAWDRVAELLDFNNAGYELFRRWYIDGRLYYHAIIDDKNVREGLQELRYVDPRKMRKVRMVAREKKDNVYVNITKEEFYMYSEKGFKGASVTGQNNDGIKIAKDAIVHATSGLMDKNAKMVLSYMHRAIKPLNQLRIMEDATVIYKINRAPERRVFYIDVGNLPKQKAEEYVRDQMVKHKNRLIYDSQTGCFAMDTKVPLLDGRVLTIREITEEYKRGERLWAYSCDPKTGEMVPGLITWAGVTHESAKVMKITLDNDEEIICTLTHKFPTWNNGIVEAKDLTVGESMIPLYRKTAPIIKGEKSEYEQIFDDLTGKWKFTHRIVSQWKDKNSLANEFLYSETYKDASKKTVHHRNVNRFDNSPENLVRMNGQEHLLYHSSNMEAIQEGARRTREKLASNSEFREEYIEKIKNAWTEEKREKQRQKCSTPERLILSSKNLEGANDIGWFGEDGAKRKEKLKNNQTIKYSDNLVDYVSEVINNTTNKDEIFYEVNSNQEIISEWRELNKNQINRNRKESNDNLEFGYNDLRRISQLKGYNTWREFKREHFTYKDRTYAQFSSYPSYAKYLKNNHNHKIAKIEYLDEEIQVGTLTIDGQERYHNYHNFALDAGIYTNNSVRDDRKFLTMLDDYWLPKRGDGQGTKIDTLPRGQSFENMDGVTYFQKKLYQAVNVPISRLDPEAQFSFGKTNEITRDELKFQKFIYRLRDRFSQFLLECIRKQLVLTGVINDDEWSTLNSKIHFDFNKDNYFAELKDAEILRGRLETLSMAEPFIGKFYSQDWIRKNVLMQTDEEIDQIDQQIGEEGPYVPSAQENQMVQQQMAGDQQEGSEQDAGPPPMKNAPTGDTLPNNFQ